MTEIEEKTGMTDAECEYLDDFYTKNTFEPGPNLLKRGVKPGFAHNTLLLDELDWEVLKYLHAQAKTFHKSHTQVINDLVREKLAVS